MRDAAGSAAAPAARCKNRRRANFVAFTPHGWPRSMAALTGRRSVCRLFDTFGGVSPLLLRRLLMLTSSSFVPLVALGESYTDFRCAPEVGWRQVYWITSSAVANTQSPDAAVWIAYRGRGSMSGLSPNLFCSAGGGSWPISAQAQAAPCPQPAKLTPHPQPIRWSPPKLAQSSRDRDV
jgi:hypothetical protein